MNVRRLLPSTITTITPPAMYPKAHVQVLLSGQAFTRVVSLRNKPELAAGRGLRGFVGVVKVAAKQV